MTAAPTSADAPEPLRSKTLATWLALLLGTLGIHRIYVFGWRDPWAWLHPVFTAAGVVGVERMIRLGQDDPLAWVLLPVFGLMISQAMLFTILWGLTPDERWDARHNGGRESNPSGWGAVIAAVAALMIGGITLTGSIAYGGQKFFEWQLQDARPLSSGGPATTSSAHPSPATQVSA